MRDKNVQIRVPVELHRALKVKCAAEGITIQALLLECCEDYVNGKDTKKRKMTETK